LWGSKNGVVESGGKRRWHDLRPAKSSEHGGPKIEGREPRAQDYLKMGPYTRADTQRSARSDRKPAENDTSRGRGAGANMVLRGAIQPGHRLTQGKKKPGEVLAGTNDSPKSKKCQRGTRNQNLLGPGCRTILGGRGRAMLGNTVLCLDTQKKYH